MIIKAETSINEDDIVKLQTICDSLNNSINNLDLNNFKGIRLIEDKNFNVSSDGKSENGIILLPSTKTQQYLHNSKEDLIKSTIYHELCHVDLLNKLPNLHQLHNYYDQKENYIKSFTIMIYIEYLAHLKSSKLETKEIKRDFFESITNKNWIFDNEVNRIYFIKCSPYIIARDNTNDFINSLADNDLKSRIIEIKVELEELANKDPLDEYDKLNKLEYIVSKYISNE